MAPESSIVAAGVGATFHLLRLVIDLVSVASETAKANDSKIESSKPGEDINSTLQSTRRLSLSTRNMNGRLSMRWNNSVVNNEDRRRGSMLRRFSLANRSSSTPNLNDIEGQTPDEDAEEPKTGLEAYIPIISTFKFVIVLSRE